MLIQGLTKQIHIGQLSNHIYNQFLKMQVVSPSVVDDGKVFDTLNCCLSDSIHLIVVKSLVHRCMLCESATSCISKVREACVSIDAVKVHQPDCDHQFDWKELMNHIVAKRAEGQ
jgi:hypothetical protein